MPLLGIVGLITYITLRILGPPLPTITLPLNYQIIILASILSALMIGTVYLFNHDPKIPQSPKPEDGIGRSNRAITLPPPPSLNPQQLTDSLDADSASTDAQQNYELGLYPLEFRAPTGNGTSLK